MPDNTKVILGYPNVIENCTLSGGSYVATLPLNNAKNRILAKKARTTDDSPSSSLFNIATDKIRSASCFAILGHNFSGSATIRLRFYEDTSQTVLLHDSGVIPVWQVLYVDIGYEWEDDHFWEGPVISEDLATFTPTFVYFYDKINIRAVKVEIFDQAAGPAYLEFGRVFLGDTFQPVINMSYGVEFGHENNTIIENALDNTEYFDVKRQKRTMRFALDALNENEAFIDVARIYRDLGVDKEMIVAFNPDKSSISFYSSTFLARNKQVNPITHPHLARYSTNLELVEII